VHSYFGDLTELRFPSGEARGLALEHGVEARKNTPDEFAIPADAVGRAMSVVRRISRAIATAMASGHAMLSTFTRAITFEGECQGRHQRSNRDLARAKQTYTHKAELIRARRPVRNALEIFTPARRSSRSIPRLSTRCPARADDRQLVQIFESPPDFEGRWNREQG